ncbi:EAL domain-containing protein [Acidithiobacillus sp. HP-6]|uniref:putative bifunctional diguanylate cyclase/phosphodiesterase n=1 Tax=unclassified Acidithiobacillus TaxID=2614800 RepID=UPI0018791A4A|nr:MULTISPECIES: EAL domain-containing protein [unclassified Acidithiobacillus]MBE7563079.1 EAL domain-containing protein [Acidithiobacillus sp. HP-6]MBE7570612.1 EAL domain-containing protein [Acidithiobacillus sp. HP-2]
MSNQSPLKIWLDIFSSMSKAPFTGSVDLPWDQAQKRLMDQMLTSLDQSGLFHTCAIARADIGHILRPLAVSGPLQQIVLENVAVLFSPDHPHARSITARAQVEDHTLLVTDYAHSEYLQHPDLAGWRQAIEAIGIQWLLATPIHRHASVWGVLVLSGLQHEPPELMADSAEKMAVFMADAMEHLETRRNEQQYREALQSLAHTDALTDLPNRRALETQMEPAMLRTIRHNRHLAVCMLDLDNFKPINDTYGHEIGDEVLVTLGKRLTGMLRKSDFIARYGGDEFVLLLEDLAGHADLVQLLKKIEGIITAPILLSNGESVQVGASMGLALYPSADTDQADQLLRWSDQALYEIKAHKADRENCWMVFGDDPLPDQRNPAQVLLDNGALEVWYQPILDSYTCKIVGIEALARLKDAEGNLWTPAHFLPELQTTDLTTLTRGVLSQALVDLAVLDGQGYSLWVSVNLDAHSVSAGCVEYLRALLAPTCIDPSRVTLEILEGDDFLEQASSIENLVEMKKLGVHLALDDLGSAYSSLLRLKTLPFDKIKLDQAFVRTLEKQPRDLYFVNTVQDLSINLGVTLVVEGVETEDILDAVTVAGVSLLQGYAIAKPLSLKELQKFLQRPAVKRSNYPHTFLGLYALHLAIHSVLEKTMRQNLRLMDYKEMVDPGICPLHRAMQHLGVLEGSPLDQRHREYHKAIAELINQLSISPEASGWRIVEQAEKALEEAVLLAYESKDFQTEGVPLINPWEVSQ